MAIYQLVDIDVRPEKSVPIDQSARLANGAQQNLRFQMVSIRRAISTPRALAMVILCTVCHFTEAEPRSHVTIVVLLNRHRDPIANMHVGNIPTPKKSMLRVLSTIGPRA